MPAAGPVSKLPANDSAPASAGETRTDSNEAVAYFNQIEDCFNRVDVVGGPVHPNGQIYRY